jgi:peptidoglycan hydrolase-like protein with peptidoglycan-binding domain
MTPKFASILVVTALTLMASVSAIAQTPAVTPKPVATISIGADGSQKTAADTVKALPLTDRIAIQGDLAWLGKYNGLINGDVSERMLAAIKTYQKEAGGKPSGVLDAKERASLSAAGKKVRDAVGWRVAQDPINGVRLGIPTKLVPRMAAMVGTTGANWTSTQGSDIRIDTWRVRDGNPTIATVSERERKRDERKVTYSSIKPDFFILSGEQGTSKFYTRGQISNGEVRGLTIVYDQALDATMGPVVIAMSSAFDPFPKPVLADTPPPRKTVEYATGMIVGQDGSILTDRYPIEGCQFITVPGYGNAARIAEEKTHGLALLRIYGATGLKPLGITSSAKTDVMLVGIADPQNQGGGAAVTSVKTAISQNGATSALAPAPGLGFAGAAAIDADGKFAGISLLRPVVVAGPAPSAPQATLVRPDVVSEFLSANKVETSSEPSSARDATVRIICIRK